MVVYSGGVTWGLRLSAGSDIFGLVILVITEDMIGLIDVSPGWVLQQGRVWMKALSTILLSILLLVNQIILARFKSYLSPGLFCTCLTIAQNLEPFVMALRCSVKRSVRVLLVLPI